MNELNKNIISYVQFELDLCKLSSGLCVVLLSFLLRIYCLWRGKSLTKLIEFNDIVYIILDGE